MIIDGNIKVRNVFVMELVMILGPYILMNSFYYDYLHFNNEQKTEKGVRNFKIRRNFFLIFFLYAGAKSFSTERGGKECFHNVILDGFAITTYLPI